MSKLEIHIKGEIFKPSKSEAEIIIKVGKIFKELMDDGYNPADAYICCHALAQGINESLKQSGGVVLDGSKK